MLSLAVLVMVIVIVIVMVITGYCTVRSERCYKFAVLKAGNVLVL